MGFSSRYKMKKNLKGKKIGAFCGIAKPTSFYDALIKEGMHVKKTLTYPDHQIPSSKDLYSFALECQKLEAELLFCTEKDQVKLEKGFSCPLPLEILSMDLVCTRNEIIWKEMVHSIQTMMKK
jgi:tetraacyldisaccharide 4'-kinase